MVTRGPTRQPRQSVVVPMPVASQLSGQTYTQGSGSILRINLCTQSLSLLSQKLYLNLLPRPHTTLVSLHDSKR